MFNHRNSRSNYLFKFLLSFFLCAISSFGYSADEDLELKRGISKLVGKSSVEFKAISTQGDLKSCVINFKTFIIDSVYSSNEPYVIDGMIALSKGSVESYGLALQMQTMRATGTIRKPVFVNESPHFAYLRSLSGATNVKNFLDKDPQTGLFVFSIDGDFPDLLSEILETKKVSIFFNRREKGIDIEVPLDLTLIRNKSDGTFSNSKKVLIDFAACSKDLIK